MDVSGQNTGNDTFSVLYCARFCIPSFHKSVELFGTSIASLDPETVELPAFSILSAMFYRSVWPVLEKLNLALMPCLNVLHMIVKLAYFGPRSNILNLFQVGEMKKGDTVLVTGEISHSNYKLTSLYFC